MKKMNTQDIAINSAETSIAITEAETAAARLAASIAEIVGICGPTIRRQGSSPVLHSMPGRDEGTEWDERRADWAGIRFSGRRQQNHTGQGHTTRCWSISGTSYYIADDARVIVIKWHGSATDFGGCAGYEDHITSDVSEQSLADYLEYAPESAQEIIDALRKAVAEDKRGALSRAVKINAAIAAIK
jgi:hypothetical protein